MRRQESVSSASPSHLGLESRPRLALHKVISAALDKRCLGLYDGCVMKTREAAGMLTIDVRSSRWYWFSVGISAFA